MRPFAPLRGFLSDGRMRCNPLSWRELGGERPFGMTPAIRRSVQRLRQGRLLERTRWGLRKKASLGKAVGKMVGANARGRQQYLDSLLYRSDRLN